MPTVTREQREALDSYMKLVEQSHDMPVTKILPILFQHKGRRYDLSWSHYCFEPMFRFKNRPRRSVWKCGRQVAKCCRVGGYGSTYLSNGRRVNGTELRVGDQLLAMDDLQLRTAVGRVTRVYDAGVKPCLRITTEMGTVLDVAETHPIRTPLGYTTAGSLSVGQSLAALKVGGRFANRPSDISDQRLVLTALMIGDGCCGLSGNFAFTSAGPQAQTLFLRYAGPSVRLVKDPRSKATDYCLKQSHPLCQWLKDDRLWGCYSYEKRLPDWVFDLDRRQTRLFLQSLWSTDGSIRPRPGKGAAISYCSTSRELAYDIKSLLLKFGIVTSVKRRPTGHRDAFLVRVDGRQSQTRFLSEFDVPDKPGSIIDFPAGEQSNRDTLPREFDSVIRSVCEQALYRHGSSLRQYGLRRRAKYRLSRAKLASYIQWADDVGVDATPLRRLYDSDVRWDRVRSIERLDEAPCWDVEVETHHNYVMDGLVVHNSTSAAHSQLLMSSALPYMNTINCLPFYEQARKFSANVVSPAIKSFALRKMFGGGGNVLQRSCRNGSELFFVSMQGTADRARGISADWANYDETQDIDPINVPVVQNCLKASPYKVENFFGTPKTFDNLLQQQWDLSSQAVWVTPCHHCGFENYASTDFHLEKMVDGPTLVCAKCRRPLNTRLGFWEHRIPGRQRIYAGYQVPQPILPMHYENPNDWAVIQEDIANLPRYRLFNEVYGESYDSGAKLITMQEVADAAVVPGATGKDFPSGKYLMTAVGVDWGGRGKEKVTDTEEHISNTAVALGGIKPDGVVEVTHLARLPYSVNHHDEVKMVAEVASKSHVGMIGIDYGGSGNVMQSMLEGVGCPRDLIIPFSYVGTSIRQPIVRYVKGEAGERSSYSLDKARSLLLLVELVKRKLVLLPDYNTYQTLLADFMAIYEESIDTPSGHKQRRVLRRSRQTDDVVQAINYLVTALYMRMDLHRKVGHLIIGAGDSRDS